VWEYFSSLRQLASNAITAPNEQLARQSAALAIVMSVTVCEVFMNLWFRVRIEEKNDAAGRAAFLKDLSFPFASLDKKLKSWPKRYLGKDLNLASGPGAAFVALKETRNGIIHFASTHETFTFENVSIHGLADTSEYDALGAPEAKAALETAEQFVQEIFRLAGHTGHELPEMMHGWTGQLAI
jgi:hypothetical protein